MSFDRSAPKPTQGFRVNEQIRISPLRVINGNGEMLGIIPREKAMELAREQELDLVEVAPTERPPVCKIMDFGKFKYEQTRKVRKVKAHQTQMKEIRLRPGCGEADLEVKLRHVREFLENKDKVQITVQFRGREKAHMEVGQDVIRSFLEKLVDIAKVERHPSRDGGRIVAVVAPK